MKGREIDLQLQCFGQFAIEQNNHVEVVIEMNPQRDPSQTEHAFIGMNPERDPSQTKHICLFP